MCVQAGSSLRGGPVGSGPWREWTVELGAWGAAGPAWDPGGQRAGRGNAPEMGGLGPAPFRVWTHCHQSPKRQERAGLGSLRPPEPGPLLPTPTGVMSASLTCPPWRSYLPFRSSISVNTTAHCRHSGPASVMEVPPQISILSVSEQPGLPGPWQHLGKPMGPGYVP